MKKGRNDLCHCGSGLKYKKCCMEDDEAKEYIERNKDLADKIAWRESDYAVDMFICPKLHQMVVVYHESVNPKDVEDEIVCIFCAGHDLKGPKMPARRIHALSRPVPQTIKLKVEGEEVEGYISDPAFMWMFGIDGKPVLKFLEMKLPWRRLDKVEYTEEFEALVR